MVIRSSIRIWLQKSVFLMKPMMSSPSGCSQVSTRHLTLILQFGIHPFPWVAMGCAWFSTEGWTRLDWGKLSVYTNDSNRTGCTHTLHIKMNVGFRGFRVTLWNFGSLNLLKTFLICLWSQSLVWNFVQYRTFILSTVIKRTIQQGML